MKSIKTTVSMSCRFDGGQFEIISISRDIPFQRRILLLLYSYHNFIKVFNNELKQKQTLHCKQTRVCQM